MTKERLSQVEEQHLIELSQNGDKRALNRLIRLNTGLVHKIVNKFPMKNANCSYEDLYQEGILGLMHAINKFDLSRNLRLSTYSYYWISARVRAYYHQNYRTVRLPVHVTLQNTQVNKTIERLTRELDRVPTLDEVCDIIPGADETICNSLFTYSLNAMIGEDGELLDTVGESYTIDNDNEIDVYFLLNKLQSDVSERDYEMLIQRYGLDVEGERTLNELAETYGVSRARCHQIESKLLTKLHTLAS